MSSTDETDCWEEVELSPTAGDSGQSLRPAWYEDEQSFWPFVDPGDYT